MKDVVIVGGGLAGLSAAWRLRHWDTVLLESGHRVGGRIRSERRGAYWLNWGGHVFAGAGSLEDRGLVRADGNNWAPRLGVVYKINEKTIARGGFGVFYNLFDRVGSEDQLALNLPGLVNTSLARTTGTPLFLLKDGIPANFLTPPNLDPAAGQLLSAATTWSTFQRIIDSYVSWGASPTVSV